MTPSMSVDVPAALAVKIRKHHGALGHAWLQALPAQIAQFLDHWQLRLDGPGSHGMGALVLPVLRADDTPAALKLRPPTEEGCAEPIGLRAWNGNGAVLLLEHDPETGTKLLERLDASRPLSVLADDTEAMQILAELLARLVAVPAPDDLPRLADVAAAMLDQAPGAAPALHDPADRRLLLTCAAAVAELVGEAGDRLLHWDLHYDNILAAQREPWLAIDPEPLAGDPGFDLLPGLDNRWEHVVASGDVTGTVLRRFDQVTEVLGLERPRAVGWTLGRVLQNALWDIQDGDTALNAEQVAIATALLDHRA